MMIKIPDTMSKLKSILSLLIILLLWPISAHASSHISFEFINLETSQQEASFPVGGSNEIIVASDDVDIRTLLPIQLKIQFDTKSLEMTIPENPQQFCRGPTGCSREGPVIPQSEGGFVEITAIDKDGNTIARYQTGTPPETPSPSPSPALSPSSTPSPPAAGVSEVEKEQVPQVKQPLLSNRNLGILLILIALALLVSASPTPPPPAAGIAEVEKYQVQEVKQPLLSNRNLGILLILIALALLVSATTFFGCPNLCTEGACQNCDLVAIRTTMHGTEPGDIEGLLKSLDYLEWLKWVPKVATPYGKKLIPAVVEKAKKIGEIIKKRGIKMKGVDVYATISWEECKKVSCWIFFTRTDWVKNQKEVKIPPFQQYRYLGMEDEAWRPERLFDEKNKEEVRLYIERVALKNCPEKCQSI